MTTISNQREPFPHEMPPPLDDCIRAFEKDLAASSDDHIPVERVFVLGAGFSRAFGFTTSADIVRGVMQFIESHPANPWLDGNFKMVDMWLYSHYPNWRESSMPGQIQQTPPAVPVLRVYPASCFSNQIEC